MVNSSRANTRFRRLLQSLLNTRESRKMLKMKERRGNSS
jgi:hypothetical protein